MTNIVAKDPIMTFYQRLRRVDSKLTPKILKAMQPDWWDDELKSSPGAVQQLKISLSRFLNLDLSSVLDDKAELKSKVFNCKYKLTVNKSPKQIKVATAILHGLAETVAQATTVEYKKLPTAQQIRQQILSSGKPWVDLSALIELCWSYGLPVLYVPDLPVSGKMDAAAIEVEQRPIIFLTKNAKHESWLLFHLAHEIGHVVAGHLHGGAMLIDEHIDNANTEAQEREANQIAFDILTGADVQPHANSRSYAPDLVTIATTQGQQKQIDPGHIVLNWAHSTSNWGIAHTALNLLYPEPRWHTQFTHPLMRHIDEDKASDDSLEYLYKLVKMDF